MHVAVTQVIAKNKNNVRTPDSSVVGMPGAHAKN